MLWLKRAAALAVAMGPVPTLGGIGWVDPDTAAEHLTQMSLVDGHALTLVMSDEFNVDGRTFNDGHDPRWVALNKNDYTNNALHFYDETYAVTEHGTLNLTTAAAHSHFMGMDDKSGKLVQRTKNFKSAMVQGWNKFCFTGGVVEVRAQLPGKWNVGGFWPAIWLMGNLARATYVGSSDWVWPWSFDACDRALQPKQRFSACNPYPHYNLEADRGRGAPEIDLLEAMPGYLPQTPTGIYQPYFSSSLQIAPGDDSPGRPQKGGYPRKGSWYEGMEYGNRTEQNVFFFGSMTTKPTPLRSYQADALSGNTQMDGNVGHGNGFWSEMHTWRVEWQLPASDGSKGLGYLRWYYDDRFIYSVPGATLMDKMGSKIPSEPSYLILNTAMSSTWGFPEGSPSGCPAGCDCACYDCLDKTGKCTCGFASGFCDMLPGQFLVDFVRVYQNAEDPHEKVGCSTPERPTSTWIQGHLADYMGDDDETPLQPLQVGGGACASDADCGTRQPSHAESSLRPNRGTCQSPTRGSGGSSSGSARQCACAAGWVGPKCRAAAGEDPIDWEPPETFESVLGFTAPMVPAALAALLALLAAAAVAAVAARARARSGAAVSLSPFSRGAGLYDAGGAGYASELVRLAGDSNRAHLKRGDSKEVLPPKTYSYGGQASEEMRKTGFLGSR